MYLYIFYFLNPELKNSFTLAFGKKNKLTDVFSDQHSLLTLDAPRRKSIVKTLRCFFVSVQ